MTVVCKCVIYCCYLIIQIWVLWVPTKKLWTMYRIITLIRITTASVVCSIVSNSSEATVHRRRVTSIFRTALAVCSYLDAVASWFKLANHQSWRARNETEDWTCPKIYQTQCKNHEIIKLEQKESGKWFVSECSVYVGTNSRHYRTNEKLMFIQKVP